MQANGKSNRIMWAICLVLAVVALIYLRPVPPPVSTIPPEQTDLQRTVVEIKAVEKMAPPPPAPVPTPPEETLAARPQPKAADSSDGRVIPIVADYRRHLGFPTYVREMQRIGAMFLLFDPIREKLIAEVDIPTKAFKPVNTARLQAMSPNIREISNEIAVEELQQKARATYDLPICSVIMLLPADVDQRLTEQIKSQLLALISNPSGVSSVSGVYLLRANAICLRIVSVDTPTGTKPADFEVKL